jgi:hypothetical protein
MHVGNTLEKGSECARRREEEEGGEHLAETVFTDHRRNGRVVTVLNTREQMML